MAPYSVTFLTVHFPDHSTDTAIKGSIFIDKLLSFISLDAMCSPLEKRLMLTIV